MSKYIPRNVLISVVPICVVITLLSVYWFRKKKKFKFEDQNSDSIVLKSDLTTEVCSDSADTLSDASSLASPMSSEKSLRTKNLNPPDCLDSSLGCDVKESPVSMTTAKAALYSSVSHPDDIMAATSIAKDIISQVERAAETVLESKSPFQPNQNKNGYDNDFLVEVDSTTFQFDMEKVLKSVETNSNDSRSSVLDENSLSYVSDDSEGRQPSKNKDSLSSVLDENSYNYVSDDSEAMTELKARDSALSATESDQEHAIPESPNTDSDSAETQNGEKSETPVAASKTDDNSGSDNADSQQPGETPPIETTSTDESRQPEVRLTNGPSDLNKVDKPATKSASPPKESIPNGPTPDDKVLYNGHHHPALNKGTFSDVLANKKPKDGPAKASRSLTNDFEAKLSVSSEPQRQQSPKRELSYSQALKGSLPKPATCDNPSSPSSPASSDECAAGSSSPPECSEKPALEAAPAEEEVVPPAVQAAEGYDEMGWNGDHPTSHEVLDDLKDSGEYRYEFELPQELCGRLIGKQGKHVRSIKDRSNANVYIKRHPFEPLLKIVVVEGTFPPPCPCMRFCRLLYAFLARMCWLFGLVSSALANLALSCLAMCFLWFVVCWVRFSKYLGSFLVSGFSAGFGSLLPVFRSSVSKLVSLAKVVGYCPVAVFRKLFSWMRVVKIVVRYIISRMQSFSRSLFLRILTIIAHFVLLNMSLVYSVLPFWVLIPVWVKKHFIAITPYLLRFSLKPLKDIESFN